MQAKQAATIRRALRDPDKWVVRIRYVDSKLQETTRVVSPIRFTDDALLALCLGRESPRSFKLDGIVNVELVSAGEVLMPEPISGNSDLETDR